MSAKLRQESGQVKNIERVTVSAAVIENKVYKLTVEHICDSKLKRKLAVL